MFGLKYIPSIADNNADWLSCEADAYHSIIGNTGFTPKNQAVLTRYLKRLKADSLKAILEIGVVVNSTTSTHIILNEKLDNTMFFGVDIMEANIENLKAAGKPNCIGINLESSSFDQIVGILKEHGVEQLDLLHIDGWHSVNQVVADFRFAELVRVGGYVVFHDTNYHPGPKEVLAALDPKVFTCKKYFDGEVDWGIAVCKRIG